MDYNLFELQNLEFLLENNKIPISSYVKLRLVKLQSTVFKENTY